MIHIFLQESLDDKEKDSADILHSYSKKKYMGSNTSTFDWKENVECNRKCWWSNGVK